MQFTADYTESQIEEPVASVLFANPEQNPDQPNVLSLQRAIDSEDSDYYWEINDQSNSGYGGIASFKLGRDRLVMQLDDKVAPSLEDEDLRQVSVNFDLDDDTFAAMRNTLRRIFDGYEEYMEE